MKNAEKFKGIFGIYATELWAKSEKEFLEWLTEDVSETNVGDMISRQAAIKAYTASDRNGQGEIDDIKFYVPKDESIPTELRLYVGEHYVEYERTNGGFLFKTLIDDEDKAMRVVERIVNRMIHEHDESEHGVSWRTVSLAVVPQDERYSIGVWIEWKYRVRDSY